MCNSNWFLPTLVQILFCLSLCAPLMRNECSIFKVWIFCFPRILFNAAFILILIRSFVMSFFHPSQNYSCYVPGADWWCKSSSEKIFNVQHYLWYVCWVRKEDIAPKSFRCKAEYSWNIPHQIWFIISTHPDLNKNEHSERWDSGSIGLQSKISLGKTCSTHLQWSCSHSLQ